MSFYKTSKPFAAVNEIVTSMYSYLLDELGTLGTSEKQQKSVPLPLVVDKHQTTLSKNNGLNTVNATNVFFSKKQSM